MLKGYWQVPLTRRAREIPAFVTPSGLYQYKVMPFGMKNAPATFQRMVNKLVRNIDGSEGYIDDVVIFSDNWSDHIHQIKRFFQIMREAKLTINLMKSEFGKATVKYLGHIVGQGQVRPLDAKIQTIVKYPIPTSVLVQEASDGLDHPVSYFSKKFLKYQKNYSVVEKETLGLVLALEHFDVYLGSTPFKIKVYTDHNPLTFLKQ